MTDQRPPIHFVDNPHAPDVFATEAVGFAAFGANVAITFAAARVSHVSTPGPVNRVVIGRLIMPVPAAYDLAAGLFDFLKQHGYDPANKPGAPPMQ